MSISSLNASSSYNNALAAALAKNGKSSNATSQSSSATEATANSSGGVGTPPDPKAMRAALDKQLESDVQSGKITQDDADKITAALDKFEANMKANGPQGGGRPSGPPPGGGAGGPPPGGGAGGASGSSSKSALEELTDLLKSSTEDDDEDDDSTTSTDLSSYLADLMNAKKVDISA
jgi:hypothetical protein